MARYADQIVNQYGAPIEGVSIYVYDNAEALAVLTEDGGGALANPVTSDQYGNFHFNAADGLYSLAFYVGGVQVLRDEAVQVGTGPVLPAEILVALSQDSGASLIGTDQSQSVQASLDDLYGETAALQAVDALGVMYVENYRGASDYATVQSAITAFIAAGAKGRLVWDKNRTYNYGTWNAGSPGGPSNIVLFPLAGLRNAVLDFNGSTHTLTTSGVQALVFYLYNYQGVVVQGLYGTDAGLTNGGDSTTGGKLIVLDVDSSNPSKDVTIRDCRAFNMNTFVNVNPGSAGKRVTGITFAGNSVADTCFYGLSCQENGDDASGRLTCRNVGRGYFNYGGTGHDISLYVEDTGTATPASEVCCLIKRKAGDTKANRLRVTFAGVLKWLVSLVDIEHEPTTANSVIDGTDVQVSLVKGYTDPNAIYTFAFRSRVDGTYEELAATFTGTTTSGNPTITGLSIPIGNFVVGQGITGANIPVGATILSINTGASTITLTANASSSTSATLTRLTKNVWSNVRLGGDIGALKAVKCFVGAVTTYDVLLDPFLSNLPSTRFTLQPGINLFRTSALNASAVYDPPSLADGAGATTTVALSGAELSDFARAAFSLDLQGITLTAWVSAADTVSVRFQNESGGTLDLASGTLRVNVTKGFQA